MFRVKHVNLTGQHDVSRGIYHDRTVTRIYVCKYIHAYIHIVYPPVI